MLNLQKHWYYGTLLQKLMNSNGTSASKPLQVTLPHQCSSIMPSNWPVPGSGPTAHGPHPHRDLEDFWTTISQ